MIIFIFLLTFKAWSFQLTSDFSQGFYWQNFPIALSVSENNPQIKARIESILEEALNEWDKELIFKLWQFSTSVTANQVRWSTNFTQETGMNSSHILALAIRNINGPYVAKTEIVINGNNPITSNDYFLKTILIHELGHTVGLDHSEIHDAVMAPNLQIQYLGLHQDDINGIHHVTDETRNRQSSNYISPLASSGSTKETQAVGCGTVAMAGSGTSGFFISGLIGVLISFIRRLKNYFF